MPCGFSASHSCRRPSAGFLQSDDDNLCRLDALGIDLEAWDLRDGLGQTLRIF